MEAYPSGLRERFAKPSCVTAPWIRIPPLPLCIRTIICHNVYMAYKKEILRLRNEGKSYNEIVEMLGCAKSTVSYYLNDNVKVAAIANNKKQRAADQTGRKAAAFVEKQLAEKARGFSRGAEEVVSKQELKKFLENVTDCYLCGDPLEKENPSSWHVDHITPKCLGGQSNLENLGITHDVCNYAKRGLPLKDFVLMCKKIYFTHKDD